MTITVDINAPSTPLHHHWSECVGAGRAAECLRADWQEQLKLGRDNCGYKRVRFHGLFHDDMFLLHRTPDGAYVFNWQYVDAVFDRLLALRVEPFIELGFAPGAIARERGTVFWWKGNGSPPTDIDTWCRLVRELVAHLLQRYGDVVRTWYWEVWNEPNHDCFFRGSRQEYFELYEHTVHALRSVDAGLRVGGPATANFVPDDRFKEEEEDVSLHSNHTVPDDQQDSLTWRGVWIEEFIQFCAERELPMDFLSFHPYPMDWASDGKGGMKNYFRGLGALRDDLNWARSALEKSPYAKAEIHCTEWNTSSAFSDLVHDELASATYAAATNAMAANIADSVSWWTFTDIFEEHGGQASCFHGGFGQINAQGLPKPLFHAYRFLHQLGDHLLWQNDDGIATIDSATKQPSLLVWNYPSTYRSGLPLVRGERSAARQALAQGEPVTHTIRLEGLEPGCSLIAELLDQEHGSVVDAWIGWDSPEPPSREQASLLQRAAWPQPHFLTADTNGVLEWTVTLQPWALLQLRAVERGGAPLTIMPQGATQPMEQ